MARRRRRNFELKYCGGECVTNHSLKEMINNLKKSYTKNHQRNSSKLGSIKRPSICDMILYCDMIYAAIRFFQNRLGRPAWQRKTKDQLHTALGILPNP